jgi:hypothetical protein
MQTAFMDSLARAIRGLREAGLGAEAEELEGLGFKTAWTSASEMLGEIGHCILRIEARGDPPLPEGVREALGECMKAVRAVWPRIALQ